MKSLAAILQSIGCDFSGPPVLVKGLSVDTRTLQAGEVFCACMGQIENGVKFIPMAVEKGAVAILYDASLAVPLSSVPMIAITKLNQKLSALADAFYDHPSQQLTMIGVTGTNGKTSVTQYFAQALDFLNLPCGILGTVGNGRFGQLQSANLTTPDPISVQKWLAKFVDQGLQAAAMEVSSHGLVQYRVDAVKFALAVFTNLTQDHLDFHHTMENYAEAKAKLFAQAALDYAVLNADDPHIGKMAKRLSGRTKVLSYGIDCSADVKVTHLHAKSRGYEITFQSPWGVRQWEIPLLGKFNVYNVLALISGLGLLGYSLEEIEPAIQSLRGAKGRMEVLRYLNKATIIIDYAHTPDALEKALQAVRTHCPGKLWLVTGCGGNRDRSKRPIMSKIATELADQVLITEDNNRFEEFAAIVDDMRPGFLHPSRVIIIPKRAEAIAYALQHASANDSILLANKGHENYLDIKGVKHPFDEREVVKEIYGLPQ